MLFLLQWYFQLVLDKTENNLSVIIMSRERLMIVGAFSVGYLLLMTAFVKQYASVGILSLYLVFLAQTMQGAASLRFFHKILDVLSGHSSSSGSLLSGLIPKIKYRLLGLFVTLIVLSLAVHVLVNGAIFRDVGYDLALLYTGFSFVTAALGVLYRLRDAPESLDGTVKLGIMLCLAGAAIYDYQTLIGDFLAFGIARLGYTVGFWIAAVALINSSVSPLVRKVRQLSPI